MHDDRDPKQSEQPQDETAKPKPRKRFQLETLEERIAPAAHYNPHTQLVGNGHGGGGVVASGGGGTGTIY